MCTPVRRKTVLGRGHDYRTVQPAPGVFVLAYLGDIHASILLPLFTQKCEFVVPEVCLFC